mgnify:CR=1 FL=1
MPAAPVADEGGMNERTNAGSGTRSRSGPDAPPSTHKRTHSADSEGPVQAREEDATLHLTVMNFLTSDLSIVEGLRSVLHVEKSRGNRQACSLLEGCRTRSRSLIDAAHVLQVDRQHQQKIHQLPPCAAHAPSVSPVVGAPHSLRDRHARAPRGRA